MDVARIPLPAIKIPPPTIVTESPPMSPLAKESSTANLAASSNNKNNKSLRRTVPSSLLTPSPSGNRPSLLPPSCPSSPSKPTTAGLTLNVSSPSKLRRAISEPAKSTFGSRRVNLGPGCGMLDWIRLCKNTKDMAGTGGEVLTVTEEELSRHCTVDDAWTCIRGKVYNITPYFKFHPGGKDDLLKAAGKDCTILFDEVHKWVNYTSMLKKCFVGNMDEENIKRNRSDALVVPKTVAISDGMNRQAVSKRNSESSDEALVHSPQSPVHPPIQFVDETDSPAIVVDPPSPIRKNSDASRPVVNMWDWNQTEHSVSIQVFIHNHQNISESDIIVDAVEKSFEASIKLDSWIYQMEIDLHRPVKNPKVNIHSNKVDIRLSKVEANEKWESIGTTLPAHNQMVSESNKVMKFRLCTVRSIKEVTHDSKLFTLEVPSSCCMTIPVGHHVAIRPNEPGNELERSYTPVRPLVSSSPASSKSSDSTTIELLIKLYKDGAMSQHLAKLSPGDKLRVSNPQGTFDATRLNSVTDLLLIAAGSGFTPMVRVLNQLLDHPQTDSTPSSSPQIKGRKAHLIFANKTQKDIIWQKEMDNLAKDQKSFKLTNILSSPDNSWEGLKGRVSSEMLKSHLPRLPASEEERKSVLVCVCGPLPFTTSITDTLVDVDYPEQCMHIFQ